MKTILYSAISHQADAPRLSQYVRSAHILGYELVPFLGYTRFGHDAKIRASNLAALREIAQTTKTRTGNRLARLWDVADEDVIRAADAEWCKRFEE
jgi:hypothetical protein